MPAYVAAPPGPFPTLLEAGDIGYAFGSKPTGPTRLLQVTKVALTSNVATVNVTMREGNIPAIGDLITIQGTANTSGLFNVTNATLTGVTIDATTGIGTVTFALTHADVTAAVDAGQAYVPVSEVGESAANGSSAAFAIQEVTGVNQTGRTITWTTKYPSAPAAATATLQGAIVDQDSEYGDLDSTTTLTGTNRSVVSVNEKFFRVKLSGVSGGSSPTIVARVYA